MATRPNKFVSYAFKSHAFGDKPVGIQTGPGGEACAPLKRGPKGFAVADFGEGDVETECTNALLEIALKPTGKPAPTPKGKAKAKAKAAPKGAAKAKAVAKKPAAAPEALYEDSSRASDSDSHEAGMEDLFESENEAGDESEVEPKVDHPKKGAPKQAPSSHCQFR